MSPNFNNIALIGDHCEDFISELKKAGHTPFEFGSADELLPLIDDYQSVALSGPNHGLTDASTISGLVDAGKVLVAFNPGTEYLNSLHTATRTPIDLTAMKPTADRPLIIYKKNEDTTLVVLPKIKTNVQIPNGKFQPVHRSNITPGRDATESAEINGMPLDSAQIVEQIKKAVDVVRQPPTEAKQPRAAGEVYGLDPGADVAFYKNITVLFLYNHAIKTLAWSFDGSDVETNDKDQIQIYHTEWQMTIHVYATNADPVGQTANSYPGTIYTYIVHDGVHERAANSPGRNYSGLFSLAPRSWAYYFVDIMRYNLQNADGTMIKVTQQPDENIVEHHDDIYQSNKKQTWIFNAEYQKPCAWNGFQMHRDTPSYNFNEAGYVLSYNDYYDVWSDPSFETDKWYSSGVFDGNETKELPDDNLAISGLTVFSSKVGKAPLHLEFDYIPRAFRTTNPLKFVSGAGVIGLYSDDLVLDLTWDE